MKTLIVLFTFLLTIFSVPANAQGVLAADENTNLIFAKIQQTMRVPEAMKEAPSVSSEHVRVLFTIDEKGKAHVMDVASNNPAVKASVTKQFEAIDFSDSPDNGINQYSITLTFRVM